MGNRVRPGETVFYYLRSPWIREAIEEFQSPNFRSEALVQFEILLFPGLGVCGLLLSRRRFVEPLWLALWAFSALGSVRHAPLWNLADVAWAGDSIRTKASRP